MKDQQRECFFILHSNHKKDLCVSVFLTKEAAEKIVTNEVSFIEQSLMYQGKKPETVAYPSGNANLYVPDTDIFHSWQILEGIFYCREDTQDSDLIPNKFGFATKECFVVLDYSYNEGTRVYAFDTRAAANECIVNSTSNMEDILRMNKNEPKKHIVPGISSCLTVPNTSIRYEWTIVESAISIQMVAKLVYVVTRSNSDGSEAFCFTFESEKEAKEYVRGDIKNIKDSMPTQEYGFAIVCSHPNGRKKLSFSESEIGYSWDISISTVFVPSKTTN